MSRQDFRANLRTIVLAVSGGLFVVLLALFIVWLPWKKHVAISGTVVDQETGEPVADARVIVTLVRNGFPYQNFMGYGLRADEKGKFVLDVVAPSRFNSMLVEASAPNDQYAILNSTGEHVILKVGPLPAYKRESPHLHYAEFSGLAGFGVGNPLNFIGPGW